MTQNEADLQPLHLGQYAGFVSRLAAFVIDWLIVVSVIGVATAVAGFVTQIFDVNSWLGLEQGAIRESEAARLHEAIGRLSVERQEVIILRFVEGLSHGQVAEILDRSEGAVRVLQHRALTALSAILKGR